MDKVIIYKAPLRAPFTACIWVSDTCNLNCKYCYAKPFSGQLMESTRLLELINELIEHQVFDITLAGGEPLLHPEIFNIIEKSVNAGIRVGLLTNGVLLNKKNIHTLEEISKKGNFIVQISIDSIDESINDYSRGDTKTVVQNLELLRKSSLEVQLACVVHGKNYKIAHTLIDNYYPDFLRFHFLNIQRTESSLNYDELLLTDEEASEFWLNLNEYKNNFPEDLFLPSLRIQMRANGNASVDPEQSLHQGATFDCSSCSAGLTHVNIDSQFNVLGCDIAKDHTIMGNLLSHSFNEVWNSKEAHNVRTSKYPPCYEIKDSNNNSLKDWLKPKYLNKNH
jgi:MoaA/NifB/PqqE/SkfB family radical SAM enzyme